jgi:hypothetical protein
LGAFSGEYIWGRGSSDDKSGVIGILFVSRASRYYSLAKFDPKIEHPSKACSRKISSLLVLSFSLLALMKRQVANRSVVQAFYTVTQTCGLNSVAVREPNISLRKC